MTVNGLTGPTYICRSTVKQILWPRTTSSGSWLKDWLLLHCSRMCLQILVRFPLAQGTRGCVHSLAHQRSYLPALLCYYSLLELKLWRDIFDAQLCCNVVPPYTALPSFDYATDLHLIQDHAVGLCCHVTVCPILLMICRLMQTTTLLCCQSLMLICTGH